MRYVAGFNATELSRAVGLTPSGTRNRMERLLAQAATGARRCTPILTAYVDVHNGQ